MGKPRIPCGGRRKPPAADIQVRLNNLGDEVAALAHSGEEALARVAVTQPDQVLMDIRLKGNMDGINTARLVRQRFNLPIVYPTGEADGATLERAKTTEPRGFFPKRIDEKRLLDREVTIVEPPGKGTTLGCASAHGP